MKLLLLCVASAGALCPFTGRSDGVPPDGHPAVTRDAAYTAAVRELDLDSVKADLKALYITSDDAWPSDYGHYGPFFIRLAWHCAGSYRTSDGRGGCDGGRQRFDPERSWEDNTNLDKARGLLWPIKQKYGLGLSWGDLFILAGTTAIESMGGPVLGFCAGRVDDADGSWSLELGPTAEQQAVAPCPVNGECEKPLGSTTIGLIYLNPEGPMAQPLPDLSAGEVRDTFARMAMNDTETVALIGGGHAFGKTHGACPDGAGPSPMEDPENPWPGMCGTGVGADAFTSGFEGAWTSKPTSWDNVYFHNLIDYEWEVWVGPGGKHQWRVANGTNPVAPAAHGNGTQPTMMMTSDISLTKDPTGAYLDIVRAFADDAAYFDEQFAHAWYKLTTRDMGPITRCVGADVPPAQPFQYPLPDAPAELANFTEVRAMLDKVLVSKTDDVPADELDGEPYYGALFVRLAWQCAATFRTTDFLGGCNGARVRLAPQSEWAVNAGVGDALGLLEPVKEAFGDALSWSDLIVLAGNAALEKAGSNALPFCGGRVDAAEGDEGATYLDPTVLTGNVSETAETLKASVKLLGLSNRGMVALSASGLGRQGGAYAQSTGYDGTLARGGLALSNAYFETILSEPWESYAVAGSEEHVQYRSDAGYTAMRTDVLLKYDSELAAIAQDFASDSELFLGEFAAAWTQLMTADRFDGPTGSVCS